MNTRTIAIITLLLAVASCQKDRHDGPEAYPADECLWVDFNNAQTKAYIDGGKTLLHSEDLFSVFHCSTVNEQWVYTGENGTTNGMISLNGESDRRNDSDCIRAIYPWNESASLTGNTISTTLPQVQYLAENSYGRGSAILTASSNTNTLHFKYATGFVCLTLSGSAQIEDIVLSTTGGESISGDCTIAITENNPVMEATGSSSILLRNLDYSPISVEGTRDFIFSIAPGTYENGISFAVTYTTGQVQTINVTEPFVVNAGNISRPVEAKCQPKLTITAAFYTDGQTVCNPFCYSIDRNIIPGTTGATSESADQFLSSDTEKKYPFRFYISNKESADHLRITRSGLNFGGAKGDYILLPGAENVRLESVLIIADSLNPTDKDKAVSYSISINDEDNVELTGARPILIDVATSEIAEACRMQLCDDFKLRIQNITLYYDTAL